MSSDNPWFVNHRAKRHAQMRLYCFPQAGSSAAVYGLWAEKLSSVVDVWAVEYAGRGSRRAERPFNSLRALVSAMVPSVEQELRQPYAIFGHCMGAFIGFELIRRIQRRGGRPPLVFFPAACRGPRAPARTRAIHDLSEAEFVAEVQSLDETPPGILTDERIKSLFLPTLRADFQAVETYAYVSSPPLACDIVAYAGASDTKCADEDIDAWRLETRASFSVERFPGDHRFLRTAEPLVLQRLSSHLEALCSPA